MSESTESRHNSGSIPELQIREIFNSAPIGIFTSTPGGRIISANVALARMFGYENPEEVIAAITDIATQVYVDPAERKKFRDLLEVQGEVFNHECRFRCRDGTELWGSMNVRAIRDKDERIMTYQGFISDITEHKKASDNLGRIEWMLSGTPLSHIEVHPEMHDQGYGDLAELNRDGIILKSIGCDRLAFIAVDYMDLLGTSSAVYEENGDYALGIFSSGWCRKMDCASRQLCGTSDNAEALKSGRWLCHESCWTDCCQKTVAEGLPRDIACNGGLRLYAVPILAYGKVVGAINFGYGDPPKDPDQLQKLANTYHLDFEDLVRAAHAYDSRPPFIIELAKKRLHATARLIGSMIETKQTEKFLKESEDRLSKIMLAANDGMWDWDLQTNVVYFDPRYYQMSGYDIDEFPHDLAEFQKRVHPDDVDYVMNEAEKHLKGEVDCFNVNFRFKQKSGDWQWIQGKGIIVERNEEGMPHRFVGTHRDISELKQVEKALDQALREWQKTFDASADAIWLLDDEHNILQANEATLRIWPQLNGKPIGMHCWDITHNTAKPVRECPLLRAKRSRHRETMDVKIDDSWFCVTVDPIFDETGEFSGAVHIINDITDRKNAEEEKERLQQQLTQAQKMESVGRLAGGVAHDFNNMLGVILGHAEMSLEQIDPGHPLFANLQEIRKAAERSADLTRQLLTFARKQTIAPRIIDLNETVGGALKMLGPLIGEDIDLVWKPGKNLALAMVDPSQIDQILANLCVNARDAIDDMGKITIQTDVVLFDEAYCAVHAGFVPGEYVMLAVSDNGCGMDPETMSHLFEPFFTTKEQGKGTGLGLASVYGAVKQNNGFINAHSEPGQGTIFSIYLPQHQATTPLQADKPNTMPTVSRAATILLVEDEPAILCMTKMMIERDGHVVITATTPNEAIRLAHEHIGTIDLLITDVVMPEMNGRDLAKNLLSIYPGIKLLFISGYTANVIAHHGVLDEGVYFMQKPFSSKDLATKLREILEGINAD